MAPLASPGYAYVSQGLGPRTESQSWTEKAISKSRMIVMSSLNKTNKALSWVNIFAQLVRLYGKVAICTWCALFVTS